LNASLKFKFIEKSLISILQLILSNQNIKRYIKYLNNNPLDSSLPDVVDDLVNTNLFISPFNEEIVDGLEVMVFFYPGKSYLKSKPLGRHIYYFDIICPLQYFLLDGRGEIRPIRIADEVAKMIDQKSIGGIGETTVAEGNLFRLSNSSNYIIYSLPIEVETASIKGNRLDT